MKRVALSFVLFLFFVIDISAQSQPDFDTNYVESFKDDLIVTLVSTLQSNTLSIRDNQNKEISFRTNNPTAYGFALDYKWLTVEYTSSFKNSVGDPRYGSTEANALGFGLTMRKFWFRNFFQRFQGYYLENPWYFDPDFDRVNGIHPHRNDVRTYTYFANINYGFNHQKFSNMASLWQIERQKKSAGSWTVGASYARTGFGADSALVPSGLQQFSSDTRLTDVSFHLLGLNGGYLYTAVLKKHPKFFLSIALIPGINVQTGRFRVEGDSYFTKKTSIGILTESRFVLGYNGDRWYVTTSGISYNIVNRYSNETPVSTIYSTARFVVGYRFKVKPTKVEFLQKIGL